MVLIKTILAFLVSFIGGFGIWYFIFFFLTSEPNLLLWHWVTKILYLIFSMSAVNGIANQITNDKL